MGCVLRWLERVSLGFGAVVLLSVLTTLADAEMFQRSQARTLELQFGGVPVGNSGEMPVVVAEVVSPPHRGGGLRRGDAVAHLEIPGLDLSVVVLHGVESDNLRLGAGHVPGTPLPGAAGNSAIAAHRDTFFRKLEDIRLDDVIHVSTWSGTFEFAVESIEIVASHETRVLETHRAGSDLTLITCYPFDFLGAAPDRFIVHARRISD